MPLFRIVRKGAHALLKTSHLSFRSFQKVTAKSSVVHFHGFTSYSGLIKNTRVLEQTVSFSNTPSSDTSSSLPSSEPSKKDEAQEVKESTASAKETTESKEKVSEGGASPKSDASASDKPPIPPISSASPPPPVASPKASKESYWGRKIIGGAAASIIGLFTYLLKQINDELKRLEQEVLELSNEQADFFKKLSKEESPFEPLTRLYLYSNPTQKEKECNRAFDTKLSERLQRYEKLSQRLKSIQAQLQSYVHNTISTVGFSEQTSEGIVQRLEHHLFQPKTNSIIQKIHQIQYQLQLSKAINDARYYYLERHYSLALKAIENAKDILKKHEADFMPGFASLSLDHLWSLIYNIEGKSYVLSGEGEKCLESYNHALEHTPHDSQLWSNRGSLLVDMATLAEQNSDYSAMLSLAKQGRHSHLRALKLSPGHLQIQMDYAWGLVVLAQAQRYNHRPSKVIARTSTRAQKILEDVWEEIVKIKQSGKESPVKAVQPCLFLGMLWMDEGDMSRALFYLDKAKEYDRKHPTVLIHRATVLFNLNRREEGIASLKEAVHYLSLGNIPVYQSWLEKLTPSLLALGVNVPSKKNAKKDDTVSTILPFQLSVRVLEFEKALKKLINSGGSLISSLNATQPTLISPNLSLDAKAITAIERNFGKAFGNGKVLGIKQNPDIDAPSNKRLEAKESSFTFSKNG